MLGALLVLVAAGWIVAAWGLPAGSAMDPLGPRGFPVLLGLVLAAAGVTLIVQGARRAAGGATDAAPEEDAGPFSPGRLLGALGLTGAYLAGLEPLGYLVTTPLYVAALLILQGGVPWRPLLLTALGLPLVLFLFFATLMGVPLPWGVLEPLRYLGAS